MLILYLFKDYGNQTTKRIGNSVDGWVWSDEEFTYHGNITAIEWGFANLVPNPALAYIRTRFGESFWAPYHGRNWDSLQTFYVSDAIDEVVLRSGYYVNLIQFKSRLTIYPPIGVQTGNETSYQFSGCSFTFFEGVLGAVMNSLKLTFGCPDQ